MKALLHFRASPAFRRRLESLAPSWLELVVVAETERARFTAEMTDTEALLHVLEPVSRADIETAPRLRLIQKIGVGVNTIDLDAARERGVAVANMPGTNSRAVAELTLALMLGALRRVAYFDARTRAGAGWSVEPQAFDGLGEVAGRTVGLVGYGAVARLLAPVLVAMGARVVYCATAPKDDALGEWRALDDLLAEADVVSLHLPLTAATRHLLDAGRLAAMRPGAVLVNTARGGLVDETALTEALASGRIAAAGLDVFADEPTAADNPLLALPNVVVMPHVAWLTPETLDRSVGIALENCRRIRDGEPLLHRVV
ncbi:MAG: hydroxyacid dehydrogenase [Chromatiales bacterium]|nr:hydroxyacid dehydrogenase [Chromatiales bacterium]